MPDTQEEKIYHDQRSVALRTTQSIIFVQDHDKMRMLDLIINDYQETQVVIVVKSKKKADAISTALCAKGLKSQSVHGNHREEQQQKAATEFNQGTLHIIITTDMILKTLKLENIHLMLSYDLPELPLEYYTRLAFMKEHGVGIVLVNPEDEPLLSDIEYNMKKEIEEKIVEGFQETDKPTTAKPKKDRSKKPRHRKNKAKKEQE